MSEDKPIAPEDDGSKATLFFELAIEAWCNQFKPANDPDDSQKLTMEEILEALNSFYGVSTVFVGTSVYLALKERGYKTIFDAAANQFKVLVSQY